MIQVQELHDVNLSVDKTLNAEIFRDYPLTFPASSRPSARRYRMRTDCFACPDDASHVAALPVLWSLPDEAIAVVAASPAAIDRPLPEGCRPAYAFSDAESPAIPTGRIFIQRAPTLDLADSLQPLGYDVESVPGYAPHAAWIVASDGSIASALSGLEKLFAAAGIDSVEPQMLRAAAFRARR